MLVFKKKYFLGVIIILIVLVAFFVGTSLDFLSQNFPQVEYLLTGQSNQIQIRSESESGQKIKIIDRNKIREELAGYDQIKEINITLTNEPQPFYKYVSQNGSKVYASFGSEQSEKTLLIKLQFDDEFIKNLKKSKDSQNLQKTPSFYLLLALKRQAKIYAGEKNIDMKMLVAETRKEIEKEDFSPLISL